MEMLDIIGLNDDDTLYVLGDVLDRGPHPIKTILKLMTMPNAICMMGNHEVMAMECLSFLMQEITDDSVDNIEDTIVSNLLTWQYNGCKTTTDEFHKLNISKRIEVLNFIKSFSLYKKVNAGGNRYLLVHAGLGNFSSDKSIDDYTVHELVWERPNYNFRYFDDVYVVSGHTPTQTIKSNPNPGYIYRNNNHIAIDCGACFPGGRLAAICLDTGEEFYTTKN